MDYINEMKNYRRNLVKKLFDDEMNDATIAHLTEYSESWIRTLRLKYQKHKEDICVLKQPGGSKCRLDDASLAKLRTILDKGAEAYGLEGAFWDRKRVQYVIAQEFKVTYYIAHLSEILSKMNYTLQKPAKKDFRQDVEKVATWTAATLPEIKKK